MEYPAAIEFLHQLRQFGAKLGLENPRRLAALAGDPQRNLRFIHVAGTNGKGSTCALLEAIYRAAGLRVGLYTSPHLVAFSERIQVNRRPVPERDIARLVSGLEPLLARFPAGEQPTFFEVATVMALEYFSEQRCDLVIWETGMGGRLDATNIVTPLASVITHVDCDHQKWLGDTLAKIAAEKAGIIKPRIPVITAAQEPDALRVISEIAVSREAPLTVVTWNDTRREPLATIELPLRGDHQRLNAATAIAAARALARLIPVSDQVIRAALEQTQWPGRLDRIVTISGQEYLLDGAHNVAAAKALHAAVHAELCQRRSALVLGILRDKDWRSMCQILAPLAKRICLVPVPSERTAAPADLERECAEAHPEAETRAFASLEEALAALAGVPLVLITGSLYLVGEALERLRITAGPVRSERDLNERLVGP